MSALFQATQAKLFLYKIPFTCPLTFNGQRISLRKGLILQLQDKQGRCSFGEIAPLPGFSSENLAQATAQIITLLEEGISVLNQQSGLYPSVQFALDNALQHTPLTKTFADSDIIPLLQGDNSDLIKEYLSLNKPPLIKLKVARQSVQQDILLFKKLTALNPLLAIRCDANQGWETEQASRFFSQINTQQLDYIEEPTPSFRDNLQLAQRYQIGLALDETLQQADFCFQESKQIKALILKPTLIGSLSRVQYFINIASQQQLQVSISSSFESIIGLLQLAYLADSYKKEASVSLGLDTLKYFQPALLTDKNRIEQDLQRLECLWRSH
ncbi:MAG: O-succinylbenzoate synthase [Psychromonas sp.]|jgi:O-succinylbenzoate synthase|uniref:o-succinylbenzoate synthase n=1 Tax=Psychromonas sp. TaxID=1884585 RepID=UPI0039E384A9